MFLFAQKKERKKKLPTFAFRCFGFLIGNLLFLFCHFGYNIFSSSNSLKFPLFSFIWWGIIRCGHSQLSMILNESLRLYPPTVATIRRAKADVKLGGRLIPGGTELLIPILAVHHDQSIWGSDASEFNPGRFSEGVGRAGNHPAGFIPFGLGVRTCIGQNLALLQAKLTMAIILQRFTFRLAPTYQHAPTVLMLLYPQYGAPIIFQKIP